jgi:hypothetical protein
MERVGLSRGRYASNFNGSFFLVAAESVRASCWAVSLLALFSLTHGCGVARQLIVESVRGGQLLWSAISLSAAAIYEAITLLEVRGATPMLELSIARCTVSSAVHVRLSS